MNYFCHCNMNQNKTSSKDLLYIGKLRITQVDSEGICSHCGYYALRYGEYSFIAENNDYSEMEKPRELIELWREQRGEI